MSQANQHRASDRLKDPNFPCHPFVISCKKTERGGKKPTHACHSCETRETHCKRKLCKWAQARHHIQQQGKNAYMPHIIVHKLLLQKGRTDALRGEAIEKYVTEVFIHTEGASCRSRGMKVRRRNLPAMVNETTKSNVPYRFFSISQVMPRLLYVKTGELICGVCVRDVEV